jgi:cytochrome b561
MNNLNDPSPSATYPAQGDDDARYDGLSIALHWATAALVFLEFGLGETLGFFPKAARDLLFIGHMSLGLVLAAVIVLRIFWRLTFGRNSFETGQDLSESIARMMHRVLYVLIVAEVALGVLTRWTENQPLNFFGLLIPSPFGTVSEATGGFVVDIHAVNAWLIMILVSCHALAALGHHYLLKDGVLRRMLPWLKVFS